MYICVNINHIIVGAASTKCHRVHWLDNGKNDDVKSDEEQFTSNARCLKEILNTILMEQFSNGARRLCSL